MIATDSDLVLSWYPASLCLFSAFVFLCVSVVHLAFCLRWCLLWLFPVLSGKVPIDFGGVQPFHGCVHAHVPLEECRVAGGRVARHGFGASTPPKCFFDRS